MQATIPGRDAGLTHDAARTPIVAANSSGASWGAILAGAAAAAALSLALLFLGTGFGLTISSPWSDQGAEASTLGISAIAWLLATQLAASALGGYIAGRLRVRWPDVQTDEIFFRDTAHGLLTWAVASLFTAAFLGSALTHAVGGGLKAGALAVGSAGAAATQVLSASGAGEGNSNASGKSGPAGEASSTLDYFVGGLFRADQPAAAPAGDGAASAAEASTVLVYSLHSGQLSADDKTRLGQLVVQRTGLSQEDAEKRATEIYYRASTELANAEAAAKGAADKARKAAAHISLWFFVALLGGAFVASYSATIGGRQRDE